MVDDVTFRSKTPGIYSSAETLEYWFKFIRATISRKLPQALGKMLFFSPLRAPLKITNT